VAEHPFKTAAALLREATSGVSIDTLISTAYGERDAETQGHIRAAFTRVIDYLGALDDLVTYEDFLGPNTRSIAVKKIETVTSKLRDVKTKRVSPAELREFFDSTEELGAAVVALLPALYVKERHDFINTVSSAIGRRLEAIESDPRWKKLETVAELEEKARAAVRSAETHLATVSSAATAAKAHLRDKGIVDYARLFSVQADSDWWSALLWAIVAVVLLGVTVGGFMWKGGAGAVQTEHGSLDLVARVGLVSLMSYSLFFCAGNYRRAAHNMIVNRHRATALGTLMAFYSYMEKDTELKSVFLAKLADVIFGHQPTGHVKAAAQDGPIQSDLLALIRDALKSRTGAEG